MTSLDSSRFRHISTSSSEYESGGIRHAVVFSNALGRRGEISFFCPERDLLCENLPVVILLHGVYGSHWSWFQQGGAHRVVADMRAAESIRPVLLACPSDGLQGEGSGYLPLRSGNFEAWVLEVPEIIRALVPACSEASPVFLCGLSMGGYGALRLGAKYPERFAGISAHSPITTPDQFRAFLGPDEADDFLAQQTSDWNIPELMSRNRDSLPPVRFDCGSNDDLHAANNAFHQELLDRRIPHTYESLPGTHEWAYWHSNLSRSLAFVSALDEGRSRKSPSRTSL